MLLPDGEKETVFTHSLHLNLKIVSCDSL